MIISANETKDFVTIISSISDNDPFACRIISLYSSYNPELAFVDYWLILDDDNGKCSGAIARSGSVFILFMTDGKSIAEVSSFIRVAGASSVLCNAEFKLELYNSKSVTGSVLMKNTPFEYIDNRISYSIPKIKDAYDLIVKCADENFVPPKFDDFYVDVNHKLRHEVMRICGIQEDDKLVAVAMTVAESENGAVLGAVACDPDYRKHGYGSSIVKYLSNVLLSENKTVYLHRAKNANVSFYNNLAFTEIGRWREYYFGG
jgi:GNAT superfamily N-acetyltransferase